MSLREFSNENKRWLQIYEGNICERSTKEKEGFERIEKDSKVFFVKRYPGFSGYVTDIEFFSKDLEGGKKIEGYNLTIEDGEELFNLSLPNNSTANSVFVNVAGNIDFEEKVDFSAWKDGKTGKTAFVVRQPDEQGEVVKRCHTKDNPNGMPKAKERKGGKLDFGDVDEFFTDKMDNEIIPRVKEVAASRKPAQYDSDGEQLPDWVD